MRTIIRVVVEDLSDEESLKLKRSIEGALPKGKKSTLELQIVPGFGGEMPPPMPPLPAGR